MRVKSVTWLGKEPVYNLEVDETHDFAVENGVIVHNCYDALRYILNANPMPGSDLDEKKPKLFDPFQRF